MIKHSLSALCLLFFASACQKLEPAERPMIQDAALEWQSDVDPTPPLSLPQVLVSDAMRQHVSTVITPTAPLQEVLMDLANQAGVNLGFSKPISGSISLSSKNQPFIDTLAHICELAGLRYRILKETIFIEPDTPYTKTYNAQFLNLQRQTQNRNAVNTDLMANTALNSSNSGSDNNASHVIQAETENDFWNELKNNLEHLLPQEQTSKSSFTFHKQGGLVTVTGTDKQHKLVMTYLDHLQKTVSSQVLIEAKIIEVSLRRGFHSGINWQAVYRSLNSNGKFGILAAGKPDVATISLKNGNSLSAVLNLLETFGKTRTLSSPRITVINNQSAVLKVAENSVYFRLKYNRYIRSKDAGGDVVLTSSDIQTVPIGLILTVQPSIHSERGEITLALRPTVTSSSKVMRDPAVEIASQNTVESVVPIVEVREIDSILHMRDGEVVVLGGLMQEKLHDNSSGLPGLRRIPGVGAAFRGDQTEHDIVELVIFLKATILKPPAQPDS